MSTAVPIYLAECSPVGIRGRLVSSHIAMVAFGQFVASIIDGVFGFDQKNGWRLGFFSSLLEIKKKSTGILVEVATSMQHSTL